MNDVTAPLLLHPPVTRLSLCLLAQPCVRRNAAPDHPLERRDAALLARLVLDGPLARAVAAQWLWPDMALPQAQANLRQRLFRLRQLLGLDLVLSTPALQIAPGLPHDLVGADDAAFGGGDMADPASPGDLLGALDYADCGALADWVDRARAQWRLGRRSARARSIDTLASAGRLAEALALARRALMDEPASEPAHRQVMRLCYLLGDRAAGLAAFEACAAALQQELEAGPGPATRELAALIQRSDDVVASAPPFSALALLRPPRLVGRAAEWQALQAGWQPGAVLLLVGEAGIGKSRLAGDFVQAQGGALRIKAGVGDDAEPYTLIVRLLQALQRDHGALPPGLADALLPLLPASSTAWPAEGHIVSFAEMLAPLRLRQALVRAMGHWSGQGLRALWLDDLQFADAASLDLVLGWLGEGLAVADIPAPTLPAEGGSPPDAALPPPTKPAPSRMPPMPPLVLLTLRPDSTSAALTTWLNEPPHGRVTRVALGPLDALALAELLQSVAHPGHASPDTGTVQALMQRTGGNPLFVLELLRAGFAGFGRGGAANPPRPADCPATGSPPPATPDRLRPLLLQRLARLDPAALRLARLAAVAGPEFSAPLAAQVLKVHAVDLVDPWQALATAQVLDDAGWVFDLMQEALLGAMPPAITRALHGGIASGLQQRDASSARIAAHAWQAGDWSLAALHSARAADAALALSRPQDALLLFDRAVSCHQRLGQADEAFAVQHRALDAAIVVELADAMAQRVDRLLSAATTPTQRLDALLAVCRRLLGAGDWLPARDPAREALHLARQLSAGPRQASAAGWLGMVLALDGQPAASQALFDEHAASVDAAGDARLQLEFASNHGYALLATGRYAEALAPLRRSVALAEQQGNLAEAMGQAGNVGVALNFLGDGVGAMQAGEQALVFWRRLGQPPGNDAACMQLGLASNCVRVGRFADALPLLHWALDQFRTGRSLVWIAVAEDRLCKLYLRLGQPALARQTLTALPADANPGLRLCRVLFDIRLLTPAQRATPAQARAKLADALAQAPASVPASDRAAGQLLLGTLMPPAEAEPWFEQLHQQAAAAGKLPLALAARMRLADALRQLGRHAESAAHAEQALQAAVAAEPMDMERSEFWWLAVQALAAGGLKAAASQTLQTAVRWINTAQAQVPVEFVDGFRQRNPFNRALLALAEPARSSQSSV